MKVINKFIILSAFTTGLFLTACEEAETPDPNIATDDVASSANILMVNASPGAPSLDLYVNNLKTGGSIAAGEAQTSYEKIAITSNAVLANTSVRAKATTGNIGGALADKNLIFRAGNNNTNNFTAADSAYYTFIVLDSITRPKPLRTINALGIGDTTYFNTLTGTYISGVERAPMPAAQKSKTVAIGTVPLGSSDPGGVRFLVVTDQLPLPSTTRFPKPASGKFAVRFIHASPNAGSVTVNVGATALPTSGATAAGIFGYPLNFPGFSPSVGSRSTTANTYSSINIGSLNVVVSASATEVARLDNYTFEDKGVYTIIVSGNKRNLPMTLTIIKNK